MSTERTSVESLYVSCGLQRCASVLFLPPHVSGNVHFPLSIDNKTFRAAGRWIWT